MLKRNIADSSQPLKMTAFSRQYNIKIIVNIFYQPNRLLKDILFNNRLLYIPINGGSMLSKYDCGIDNLVFDNSGENISNKNGILNEMTSIYWVWKNYQSIGNPCYIGHNHYRRFFDIKDIQDYTNYDIIISKPIFSSDKIPLVKQYLIYHNIEDLLKCANVIREFGKDIGDAFVNYMNSSGINYAPCNMFVMKRELFFEWCEFLFPIMFRLENIIDLNGRDNYQKRALCFLSERIFNFWCYNKKLNGYNIKEIPIHEYLDFKPKFVNERGDFS